MHLMLLIILTLLSNTVWAATAIPAIKQAAQSGKDTVLVIASVIAIIGIVIAAISIRAENLGGGIIALVIMCIVLGIIGNTDEIAAYFRFGVQSAAAPLLTPPALGRLASVLDNLSTLGVNMVWSLLGVKGVQYVRRARGI
jgi:hypothetical protein